MIKKLLSKEIAGSKPKNLLYHRVQEATDRGSTLISHLKGPLDAGQAGGIHIPRAPGRTFTDSAAGTLSAGDAPSLVLGGSVTLSVHRAMQFLRFIILTGLEECVKKFFPGGRGLCESALPAQWLFMLGTDTRK